MTKSEDIKNDNIPLAKEDDAPMILIDGYEGVTISNGIARFNFFTIETGTDLKPRRVVSLRLAVPFPVVGAMVETMSALIAEMRKTGSAMQ